MTLSDEERAGLMKLCDEFLAKPAAFDILDLPPIARALKALLSAQASPAIQGVDVVELERLARAATPGTWHSTSNDIWIDTREQVCCGNFRMGDAPWDEPSCCGEPDITGGQEQVGSAGEQDAAYIAAANPQVILSILSSLTRPMVEEPAWRLIDEWKPSDGDVIVCTDEGHVGEASYYDDPGHWYWAGTNPSDQHDGQVRYAKYFRAFPSPPNGTRSAREALSPERGGDGSGPEGTKP